MDLVQTLDQLVDGIAGVRLGLRTGCFPTGLRVVLLARSIAPGRSVMARLKRSPGIHWKNWAMWVNKARILHVHIWVKGRASKVKTWEIER